MNKKGFTLIELLVVIAIIGLLSSIVFASISTAREKANATKTKVQAQEITKAVELSRLSNGTLPIQTDSSQTMRDIVESVSSSPLKTAIQEYYSGPIPEIPSNVGGDNNEYYYISDGNDAKSDNEFIYTCGVDTLLRPENESITFWKSNKPAEESTINDNSLYYVREVGLGVYTGGPDFEEIALGYSLTVIPEPGGDPEYLYAVDFGGGDRLTTVGSSGDIEATLGHAGEFYKSLWLNGSDLYSYSCTSS